MDSDIVAEPAAGDIGAGGGGDGGAQRRPRLRLVPQGQAQAGAEPRRRRPAVGRPAAHLNLSLNQLLFPPPSSPLSAFLFRQQHTRRFLIQSTRMIWTKS